MILSRAAGVFAGILWAALTMCAKDSATFMFAGHVLSVGLIDVEDRRPVDWRGSAIQLTTDSVTVGPNFSVAASLVVRRIEPDVGAYTIIYSLNPSIQNLDHVAPGSQVKVPVVVAKEDLEAKLADGSQRVVLFVDPDLRELLYNAAKSLPELAGRLHEIPVQQIAADSHRTTLTRRVDDISSWYAHIQTTGEQRKGPTLSRQTLEQLRDEADALTNILRAVVEYKEKLSSADDDQIRAIHQDLTLEMGRFDEIMSGVLPGPEPLECCAVLVTISGETGQLERLRVYYLLNGLFRLPLRNPIPGLREFPELGSGKLKKLAAMNYQFWAAIDGHPNDFLTTPVMVELRTPPDGKPQPVQLALIQPDNKEAETKSHKGRK